MTRHTLGPELQEYQRDLRREFRRFLERESPVEAVRRAHETGGVVPGLAEKLADLGGFSLSLPEDVGGGGGSLTDATLVGMELGRQLAPLPYADTVAYLRAVGGAGGPVDDGDLSRALLVTVAGFEGLAQYGLVADLLVLPAGDTARVVHLREAGVQSAPVPNLGRFPMARVHLESSQSEGGPCLTPKQWRAMLDEQLLLSASYLVGAGQRALELTVDHVKVRHQFGRPLGGFQALQHRLADRATAMDAAELLVLKAAASVDEGHPDARRLCAAAFRTARSEAEATAGEGLQMFGGYGFTLEYDIHLYVRVTKALGVWVESCVPTQDALLARRPAGDLGEPLTAEAEGRELWDDVVEFVEANVTEALRDEVRRTGTEHDPGLHKRIAERGWIGMTWPTELGGQGLRPEQHAAYWEAMHFAEAPINSQMLTEMVGYAILTTGTDEQRRRFLPGIANGDQIMCLGYSEPDSGSDLASANTAATRVDGGYVIHGNKMFTTMAHVSDHVLLLARTSREGRPHDGLTMFVVPLSSEGIQIRPVHTLGGERTNAVFYDNVFVDAANRLGDEGAGWKVLTEALNVERSMMGAYIGGVRRLLVDLEAELSLSDGLHRTRLAEFGARLEAAAALCDRVSRPPEPGQSLLVEAAMAKLAATELFRDVANEAIDLIGPGALIEDGAPDAVAGGRIEHAYRHSKILTIYGGSNEIQRNIVAYHGLNLPRF